jgi:nitroreductase
MSAGILMKKILKNQNQKKAENFFELVKNRKTTYEFSDKKISDADLQNILDAGRWAPSSHNSQPWRFIVIKNKSKIESLIKICYYGEFHTLPQTIIAVVLEPTNVKQEKATKGDTSKMYQYHKYINIAMPTLTMSYEAADLGIGSCLLSPIIPQANKILKVPKGKEAVLLLGIGYEKQNSFKKDRVRAAINQITFHEEYGRK